MQINHLSIIKSTRQVIDIRYTREKITRVWGNQAGISGL